MRRAELTRSLAIEARQGAVSMVLSDDRREWPKNHWVLMALSRRPGKHINLNFADAGFGITLHRHGGLSLCGVPKVGGTSILWGASRKRVRALGKGHRAIELGPAGIYIGRDF